MGTVPTNKWLNSMQETIADLNAPFRLIDLKASGSETGVNGGEGGI
jgi:hypothetical protein